tara:strand:+ start:831 stop:1187 length:357 start_codon:yes stop_codon:yes gene_type:complete
MEDYREGIMKQPGPGVALLLTITLILAILMFSYKAEGKENLHCVIEVIYDESLENEVSRRMICRDGEIPGQPGYWQLFAAFYYNGVSVPEYCRYVKGDNLFRIPNKICLNKDGTWRDG